MGLKDELDSIAEERAKREAQMLSDEEVYNVLSTSMYNKLIVNVIKKAVSEGQTQIEGEFILSYATMYLDGISWERLSKITSVYEIKAGYDEPDSVCFRDLYVVHKPMLFKGPRVELTPLGERVYRDLKELALKDQVLLSEPYQKVGYGKAYGTSTYHGSMRVNFTYKYER